MREIRPSGSVEGVMSNRDPYSDLQQQNYRSWLCSRRIPYSRALLNPDLI
jgi:hypothetical protein